MCIFPPNNFNFLICRLQNAVIVTNSTEECKDFFRIVKLDK